MVIDLVVLAAFIIVMYAMIGILDLIQHLKDRLEELEQRTQR